MGRKKQPKCCFNPVLNFVTKFKLSAFEGTFERPLPWFTLDSDLFVFEVNLNLVYAFDSREFFGNGVDTALAFHSCDVICFCHFSFFLFFNYFLIHTLSGGHYK